MTTQDCISSRQLESKGMSTQSPQNDDSDDKNKEVYFLILIPSESKINFSGLNYEAKNKIEPWNIFNDKIDKEDGTHIEEIVFKFKKKSKKKQKDKGKNESTKYAIRFFEGNYIYDITFSIKDISFVYEPKLEIRNKFLPNIPPEPIEQNIVPLCEKLNIFLKALQKENNEIEKKEEKLYEDTIVLYEDKKKFSLLITLFLKIYENNKVLCNKLIGIFNKINDKENDDRDKDLKNHLDSFKDIYSKAKDILEGIKEQNKKECKEKNKEENKYEINFYGILFSYLHYYDKANFPKMIEEFSEGNSDILYEILIQYYSHFMNPLKQNQAFYNKFVKYALEKDKDIKIFKRILNYIEDIETFLFVINSNMENIFKLYDKLKKDPIKMTASLKLVKYKHDKTKKVRNDESKNKNKTNEDSDDESENSNQDDTKGVDSLNNIENECTNIIKLIKDIIAYSHKEQFLVIYLKSTFWINLIKEYNIPDWENISNIYSLRELYKLYYNLVDKLYEDSSNALKKNEDGNNIKSDIKRYLKRDEFAFMLNKLIKDMLEAKKIKITNAEILATVEQYNPYFGVRDKGDRENYKNNREVYIFDYVNFKEITAYFIKAFRGLNFEEMFEENIHDYINKITSKIEDIQTFGNIIKLINENKINEEKQKDYLRILKDKYKIKIKDNIKLIKNDKELDKAIKIIAEFIGKVFLFDKNIGFLEEEIRQLDEKIKSLIYIELIITCKDNKYDKMKNYIYGIYLEKIHTKEGRENIIKLVKNLNGEDRKFFIYEKLLERCQFTKEKFFSNEENDVIQTLCLLNKSLEKESQEKEDQKNDNKNKKNVEILNILEIPEKWKKNAETLLTTLDSIFKDLSKGIISKKDLEKFLNIKKEKNKQIDAAIKKENKNNEKKNENDK